MKIFQMKVEDVVLNEKKIMKLLRQSYLISFPKSEDYDDSLIARINSLKKYISEGKATVIAAKNNHNELIGFVWFFEKEPQRVLHINSIVVDEKYRKQGVGKALWKEIEDYAKHHNIEEIELFVSKKNEEAVKFYENREFKVERFIMKKRL